MWVVAVLTMVVGAVIAITQTDVKRLLAYSSIAHAGFILTAVIAVSAAGLSSRLFYLATYGLTTVGAFAVITLVRDTGGEAATCPAGRAWASARRWWPGSSRCSCWPSPGIPLTSGFIGKFAVFQAAIASGETALVIVGVLSSAIAAFFYVRVIVLMFFSDPVPDGPEVAVPNVFSGVAVGLGVAATIVFGIVPEPLLCLANHAANSLFVQLIAPPAGPDGPPAARILRRAPQRVCGGSGGRPPESIGHTRKFEAFARADDLESV